MKKRIMLATAVATSFLISTPVLAQDRLVDAQSSITIVESNSHLSSLFRSVWAGLKSISPQLPEQTASNPSVATAGIRGNDDTGGLLKLYWKDDLANDESFQAELRDYRQAIDDLSIGRTEQAIAGFQSFIDRYDASDLRSNALLGKAISQASIGKNAESLTTLERFVTEYPGHPLVLDARKLIAGFHGQTLTTASAD